MQATPPSLHMAQIALDPAGPPSLLGLWPVQSSSPPGAEGISSNGPPEGAAGGTPEEASRVASSTSRLGLNPIAEVRHRPHVCLQKWELVLDWPAGGPVGPA